jgi:hypothetical protein
MLCVLCQRTYRHLGLLDRNSKQCRKLLLALLLRLLLILSASETNHSYSSTADNTAMPQEAGAAPLPSCCTSPSLSALPGGSPSGTASENASAGWPKKKGVKGRQKGGAEKKL